MIFESLLIHFSDFSRFSGSPSANFRKNREIGRIQTPLRILGEHPWNRRVECESGRFTDFWGFSQAPHQQIETWARFSLEIHGCSPKMRSGVWIHPISRFFRKFADGEPTKIRKIPKIVRVPPPRLGREARHATTQRAPKIGREPPRDDPKGT